MPDETKKFAGRVMLDGATDSQETVVTVTLQDGDLGKEVCFSTDGANGDYYLVVLKEDLLRFIQ